MKNQVSIEIRNGSGWNNYQALRALRGLPAGTRKLMGKNGVAKITVGPRDADKPFGIAARYFDSEGEEMFCQGFDQNDSGQWIRERVTALLTEGIENRISANQKKIDAEELEAANAAGYATAAEHQATLRAAAQAKVDAKNANRLSIINDPERAARAEADLRALLPVISAHPAPPGFQWRIDRKGWVGCYDHNGREMENHPKTGCVDRDDMYAWLHQHGYGVSLDNRHLFFDSICK